MCLIWEGKKLIYKARYKTDSNSEYQTLTDHLLETAMYVELFANKIGLSKLSVLTALTHDLGKNTELWQEYLENSHKTGKKYEKMAHGTAGGQYLYNILTNDLENGNEFIAQLLAACVMYHHGAGLPDVINPDGTSPLFKRILIDKKETHVDEAAANLDESIKKKLDDILSDKNFIPETLEIIKKLTKSEIKQARYFNLGLVARFLSSCLIDGDRRSSALFDKGISVKEDEAVVKPDWKGLLEKLENHLKRFPSEGSLNEVRRMVSDRCAEFAKREDGIYTLTAATGAGKTLASLRYALAHAEETSKDHIFIIAPYTSILDQNADVIRNILDPNGKNGQIILEQHSNLDNSEITEHYNDSSQTWNVPIIITTMVQFLETLFASGTRKIRRMHQLANSVIIFDEIQTLPASCTYLFTWAIKFLSQKTNTSILLCTATQPGFDKLKPDYAIPSSSESEIIPDIVCHFEELKRVELIDLTRGIHDNDKNDFTGKWSLEEVADYIGSLNENSLLTVVNTKSQAQKLYKILVKLHPDWHIIHLSTNMCPAHRRRKIAEMKEYLKSKTKKCVCISTRLIEAGVDIDFDGAIRFLAGFDSIIQTAGRCNRNGELKDSKSNLINGKTWIVNIVKDEEIIKSLPDLIHGQEIMETILRRYHSNEKKYNYNLLHPELISDYFIIYYGQLSDSLLKYKVTKKEDTILDLLSDNSRSIEEYDLNGKSIVPLKELRQAFDYAWHKFEVISQDLTGVIVPFADGDRIIKELYSQPDFNRCLELLQEAQQFSVNIFPNKIPEMIENKIITRVPLKNDLNIYTVEEQHYDQNVGLSDEEGIISPKIA